MLVHTAAASARLQPRKRPWRSDGRSRPIVGPSAAGSPRKLIKYWKRSLGIVIFAVLVFFAVFVGPWLLTRHPSYALTAEQQLKARNDVRTTLVQALGAAGLFGGLFF